MSYRLAEGCLPQAWQWRMLTSTGAFKIRLANVRIFEGMVAEIKASAVFWADN